MKAAILLAAAASLGLAAAASAQQADMVAPLPPPPSQQAGAPSTAAPSPDALHARAAHAEERINAGLQSGDLTPGEGHRALEDLANIRTQENELATRDGGLNDTDRQFINDRLSQLHRGITWLKNNAAYAW
ncbi:MAG TPA: hypothetical protein VGM25_13445 [Caulobacteraceae bacterium]|jgi:hypothetical protein